MPRRVFSISHFCTALTNSACSRAGRVRRPAPGLAISLGRDTSPMPEPMSAWALVGSKPALRVLDLAFAVPDPLQLRDLLLERHAPEQIGDAGLYRRVRLSVDRRAVLRQHAGADGGDHGRGGDEPVVPRHCRTDSTVTDFGARVSET